jgi:single-stranded DNA-binding protein
MARNSVNHITLLGNIGTSPELYRFNDKQVKTTFRMATNERFKTSDGQHKEHTEWHTIVTWGRLAELCKHYVTEIVADDVLFLDGGKKHEDYHVSDDANSDKSVLEENFEYSK